jgi:predicted hydrocarbon binding protein
MQGIMFIELSRFIDDRLGSGEWEKALMATGLSEREYNPRSPGPDEEFIALVTTVADTAGQPVQTILEAFGEFVAPDLLGGLYGLLLNDDWDLLDFLEHTEGSIHTVVRARDPAAEPPRLRIVRPGPNEVFILYDSPRRMCSVAKGIIRGASKHFEEPVEILESRCMLAGAARCEITVRRPRP